MILLASLWILDHTRLVSLMASPSRILSQLLSIPHHVVFAFLRPAMSIASLLMMSDDLNCQLLCYTRFVTRPVFPASILLSRYPWCLRLLDNCCILIFSYLPSSRRSHLPRSSILVSQLYRTANPPPIRHSNWMIQDQPPRTRLAAVLFSHMFYQPPVIASSPALRQPLLTFRAGNLWGFVCVLFPIRILTSLRVRQASASFSRASR